MKFKITKQIFHHFVNKALLLCVNILLEHTFSFFLLLMIRSSPLNAPDATNRMLVVSTCTVSPLSFLVFFSGTLTIVPSSSLSKPYKNNVKLFIKQKHYHSLGYFF